MSAILSKCGKYRYQLERRVHDRGPTYGFFGVNPSTADASSDDATVRKVHGFVRHWGGGRFLVANAFAYRATHVRELQSVADPVGPDNDLHIERVARQADILVPCWGKTQKLPPALRGRLAEVLERLRATGKPILCFGLTLGGDPRHPLMLSYATRLAPMKETCLAVNRKPSGPGS